MFRGVSTCLFLRTERRAAWLVIFIGRMIGTGLTGRISRGKLLLIDGFGLFAFFLLLFFSRAPGPVVLGRMGTGFLLASILLSVRRSRE